MTGQADGDDGSTWIKVQCFETLRQLMERNISCTCDMPPPEFDLLSDVYQLILTVTVAAKFRL